MKIKTHELRHKALDYAVAKAMGYKVGQFEDRESSVVAQLPNDSIRFIQSGRGNLLPILRNGYWNPSTNWAQGGLIIDQEGVFRIMCPKVKGAADTVARLPNGINGWYEGYGPTPLIAAMRVFVESCLGEYVDIPEELL